MHPLFLAETHNGWTVVNEGDYLILDPINGVRVCRKDIFQELYL
jgi:hypothetical protein